MKYIYIAILWLLAITAWCIPAQPIQKTVKGPDGAPLTIVLHGDENYHFYTTLDGVPVIPDEVNDCWVLAPQLADSISTVWSTRLHSRNAHRVIRAAAKRRSTRSAQAIPTTQKKGLVLLVNFPDMYMKSTSTLTKFRQMFNQEGYSGNNSQGSVHDYFHDQSYGAFDLTFDVVGPVTASKEMAYYGENDDAGEDMHPAQLVAEACQLARNNYDLTWSDYDWDGDGEIEQVYVIYAGYGEHAGAAPNTIWPHEWTLKDAQKCNDGDGPISIDGCTINTYAISSELSGAVGSTMNSVGVACHEFSHCLGLPDFYSTNYSKSFGMGAWDIMSHGEYNGPNGRGECPPPFTAYERWFCGWFEPIVLKSDQAITEMPDLQDEPVAYLIRNEAYPSEYFLLENRQPNRWGTYVDKSTGMHGMLVCHVDEDEDAWRLNRVNTSSSHPRMTIIPANQTYGSWRSSEYDTSETQYRGQPFPGSQDVTVLDSLSHPQYAGTLFHNNTHGTRALPFTLSNISESDGLISFQFSIPGNQSLPDAIKMIRTEEKDKRSNSILFPVTSDIYITQDGEKVLIR